MKWASMLPPQAQDFALSFIAKRLAIQLPSKALSSPKEEGLFSSSLAQYIPFIKQLTEKSFPLKHVTMRTLLEVLVLQLRTLTSAIETIDESDSSLDIDLESKHASEYMAAIHVSRSVHAPCLVLTA